MKTTVVSCRGFALQPSRCYDYEFESVVIDLLGATLLAPEPSSAESRSRRGWLSFRGDQRSRYRETRIMPTQDLLLMNCHFLDDVRMLRSIPNWRDDSRHTVCWIKELFAESAHDPECLAILDRFDVVYLNFQGSVAALRRVLPNAEVRHVPLGIDAVRFCPFPHVLTPSIDVYWLGRIEPSSHHSLQREADEHGLFYVYTSIIDNVMSPQDHRVLRSRMINHSWLFGVQPAKFNEPQITAGQQEIGFRYFEGAAGGAALVGRPPDTPAFAALFPWPDAVIETPPDPDELAPFIVDLLAQKDRLRRIRRASVTHCLRNHDWLFRIADLLDSLDLTPSPIPEPMQARQNKLDALAEFAVSGTPS